MEKLHRKLYWHVHHEILFESWNSAISNRYHQIKNKVKSEQDTRRKLLKPIKDLRTLGDQTLLKHAQTLLANYNRPVASDLMKKLREVRAKTNKMGKARHTAVGFINREIYRKAPNAAKIMTATKVIGSTNTLYRQLQKKLVELNRKTSTHSKNAYIVVSAWNKYVASITSDQIAALHAKECPNCPWNGRTIFPISTPSPKVTV